MRSLIKKILKESDELDWVENSIEDPIKHHSLLFYFRPTLYDKDLWPTIVKNLRMINRNIQWVGGIDINTGSHLMENGLVALMISATGTLIPFLSNEFREEGDLGRVINYWTHERGYKVINGEELLK